jgi:hypothetical protein
VATEEKALPALVTIRAECHDQVGSITLRGSQPLVPDSRAVEVLLDEIEERKVALAARRVERDQPGEQLDVVKASAGQRYQPAAIRRWRGEAGL